MLRKENMMTMQMPITCTENAAHAIARYTKWKLFQHYISIFIFLLNLSLILFYSIINAKTTSDLLPPFFFYCRC
jgi:hypothetical protein